MTAIDPGLAVIEAAMEDFMEAGRASWRKRQYERIAAMCDAHASIVKPDGTVGGIDPAPLPYWTNNAGRAATGRSTTGGASEQVPNGSQCVIGSPRGGTGTHALISGRESARFSDVGVEE